jgi:hypothetical protein
MLGVLLLLLRFAVTLEHPIDLRGACYGSGTRFARRNEEVCHAIVVAGDGQSDPFFEDSLLASMIRDCDEPFGLQSGCGNLEAGPTLRKSQAPKGIGVVEGVSVAMNRPSPYEGRPEIYMKSLYRCHALHLASIWPFAHLDAAVARSGCGQSRCAMLNAPRHNARAVALEQRLRSAPALTPELMSEVIAQACTRLLALQSAAKTKFHCLIDSGAWTDAALALLELELPQWRVRRLVWEDGEWFCSLSDQPWIPLGLDDLAEASHESLPLAILLALLEGRAVTNLPRAAAVPSILPAVGHAVCCDNFA